MAKWNELQVGRFNRFAQKLFSMKGPANLDQLANDLRVVYPWPTGSEDRYLQGWDLFTVDTSPAAGGAGNVTVAQIRNPVGSNVIAVITRAQWFEALATNAGAGASCQFYKARTVDFANLRTASPLDPRGRQGPTCIISDAFIVPGAIPAGGVGMSVLTMPANSVGDFFLAGDEIVLPPGTAFIDISGNVNTGTNYNFRWRERFLEDSERA